MYDTMMAVCADYVLMRTFGVVDGINRTPRLAQWLGA